MKMTAGNGRILRRAGRAARGSVGAADMVGRSGDAGIWSVFEKKRVIVTRRPGGLQRRGIAAGARSGTRASG
ncbi:hypothetical protein, partial [Burkholderia pseudomallei]|uniref:hypothetical protein n=1 Tax=Burkholderia pseudomallei TaxID=28450 RepID=UPI001CA4BBA9